MSEARAVSRRPPLPELGNFDTVRRAGCKTPTSPTTSPNSIVLNLSSVTSPAPVTRRNIFTPQTSFSFTANTSYLSSNAPSNHISVVSIISSKKEPGLIAGSICSTGVDNQSNDTGPSPEELEQRLLEENQRLSPSARRPLTWTTHEPVRGPKPAKAPDEEEEATVLRDSDRDAMMGTRQIPAIEKDAELNIPICLETNDVIPPPQQFGMEADMVSESVRPGSGKLTLISLSKPEMPVSAPESPKVLQQQTGANVVPSVSPGAISQMPESMMARVFPAEATVSVNVEEEPMPRVVVSAAGVEAKPFTEKTVPATPSQDIHTQKPTSPSKDQIINAGPSQRVEPVQPPAGIAVKMEAGGTKPLTVVQKQDEAIKAVKPGEVRPIGQQDKPEKVQKLPSASQVKKEAEAVGVPQRTDERQKLANVPVPEKQIGKDQTDNKEMVKPLIQKGVAGTEPQAAEKKIWQPPKIDPSSKVEPAMEPKKDDLARREFQVKPVEQIDTRAAERAEPASIPTRTMGGVAVKEQEPLKSLEVQPPKTAELQKKEVETVKPEPQMPKKTWQPPKKEETKVEEFKTKPEPVSTKQPSAPRAEPENKALLDSKKDAEQIKKEESLKKESPKRAEVQKQETPEKEKAMIVELPKKEELQKVEPEPPKKKVWQPPKREEPVKKEESPKPEPQKKKVWQPPKKEENIQKEEAPKPEPATEKKVWQPPKKEEVAKKEVSPKPQTEPPKKVLPPKKEEPKEIPKVEPETPKKKVWQPPKKDIKKDEPPKPQPEPHKKKVWQPPKREEPAKKEEPVKPEPEAPKKKAWQPPKKEEVIPNEPKRTEPEVPKKKVWQPPKKEEPSKKEESPKPLSEVQKKKAWQPPKKEEPAPKETPKSEPEAPKKKVWQPAKKEEAKQPEKKGWQPPKKEEPIKKEPIKKELAKPEPEPVKKKGWQPPKKEEPPKKELETPVKKGFQSAKEETPKPVPEPSKKKVWKPPQVTDPAMRPPLDPCLHIAVKPEADTSKRKGEDKPVTKLQEDSSIKKGQQPLSKGVVQPTIPKDAKGGPEPPKIDSKTAQKGAVDTQKTAVSPVTPKQPTDKGIKGAGAAKEPTPVEQPKKKGWQPPVKKAEPEPPKKTQQASTAKKDVPKPEMTGEKEPASESAEQGKKAWQPGQAASLPHIAARRKSWQAQEQDALQLPEKRKPWQPMPKQPESEPAKPGAAVKTASAATEAEPKKKTWQTKLKIQRDEPEVPKKKSWQPPAKTTSDTKVKEEAQPSKRGWQPPAKVQPPSVETKAEPAKKDLKQVQKTEPASTKKGWQPPPKTDKSAAEASKVSKKPQTTPSTSKVVKKDSSSVNGKGKESESKTVGGGQESSKQGEGSRRGSGSLVRDRLKGESLVLRPM